MSWLNNDSKYDWSLLRFQGFMRRLSHEILAIIIPIISHKMMEKTLNRCTSQTGCPLLVLFVAFYQNLYCF